MTIFIEKFIMSTLTIESDVDGYIPLECSANSVLHRKTLFHHAGRRRRSPHSALPSGRTLADQSSRLFHLTDEFIAQNDDERGTMLRYACQNISSK